MTDIIDALYDDGQDNRSEEDYPIDAFLQEKAPLLHDFVRFDRYKGKRRANGKFTVTCQENLWVLSITDPDRSRSFSCTGLDFVSALATMDQLIQSGQVAWRYWGKPDSKTTRSRKS